MAFLPPEDSLQNMCVSYFLLLRYDTMTRSDLWKKALISACSSSSWVQNSWRGIEAGIPEITSLFMCRETTLKVREDYTPSKPSPVTSFSKTVSARAPQLPTTAPPTKDQVWMTCLLQTTTIGVHQTLKREATLSYAIKISEEHWWWLWKRIIKIIYWPRVRSYLMVNW